MRFIDRLLGRKKEVKPGQRVAGAGSEPPTPEPRATPPASRTPGTRKISRMYAYIGTSAPVSSETSGQILAFVLDRLKLDTLVRGAMTKEELAVLPIERVNGVARDERALVSGFQNWLQGKGVAPERSIPVAGKKMFIDTGSLQDPTDGTTVKWGVVLCFG